MWTVGVDFYSKKLDIVPDLVAGYRSTANMHIWDTVGQVGKFDCGLRAFPLRNGFDHWEHRSIEGLMRASKFVIFLANSGARMSLTGDVISSNTPILMNVGYVNGGIDSGW